MLKIITAYARLSKLSIIHPIEKLALSIIPIVILGFCKSPIPLLINIAMFIVLHFRAKTPTKIVIKFTLEIAAFAAFSSITFVLDYGVFYCGIIVLRSLSAGLCLAYFSLSTPFDDLLLILSKFNSIKDICDIAKSMQRFIVLIEEEYGILYKAIKSRGGFSSFKSKIKDTGKMGGLLFVNTLKRWKYIKEGIDSRCYRGAISFGIQDFNISTKRVCFIGAYNLALIFLVIY